VCHARKVLSKVVGRSGRPAPSPANEIGAKEAIGAVVAWVDGGDRKHRARRNRYLADPGGDSGPEQVANKERRFSDNDEIRFCLRSIRNYAPWVRTIWLVTDNQVPAAIDRRRAERDNIRIVDHREIFHGYEQLLPTFNSLSIETMLWRIDGLADRFLYFNDDMMLVGPAEPTDFGRRQSRSARPLEQLDRTTRERQ
jgi:Stealth protein CR2, conserved region 2